MEKINLWEPSSTRIGRVRFNHESSCIFIDVMPGFEYDVSLKRCRTADEALGWISQISKKRWGREVMADLVKMIDMWAGPVIKDGRRGVQ